MEDDGRGFDVAAASSATRADAGLGLAGMKERTILSGGLMSIESAVGEWTAIRATWPSPAGGTRL